MVGMDAAVVLAALAAAAPPPPLEPARAAPEPAPPRVSERAARTLGGAVRRAHLTGAITWAERQAIERDLAQARRAARRLPPARSREIRGALDGARQLAARGRLGGERLTAVMSSIRATTYVMRLRPFPAPGARVTLPRDGLVYEFRAGRGLHVHPLATAGRLNGLAEACLHERPARCRPAALRRTADALAGYGVRDGGRLQLEYTYPFGRGDAPWTSSMAQATAAQALARAGRALREPRYARAATATYRALVSDATAVRSGGRVTRFAMYSFQPSMRVLNGELQTLVGLADYARLSGSRDARRVLRRTARSMARSLGAWDTGAWTLYSAGGREATLHYHRLAEQFAGRACAQAVARGFCPAARRYARYTREPPRLTVHAAGRVRAPRRVLVTMRASKLTHGTLVVRGPRGFELRRPVTLGRRAVSLRVPVRRAGRFRVVVTGRAVNGRTGTARTLVRARPRPKPKRKPEPGTKPRERERDRDRPENQARREGAPEVQAGGSARADRPRS
jgi:hypothetical protein